MEFANKTDIERADNLNWRGKTFCPMGGELAISNANKMAKLIKDPNKILGRLEAVASRWSNDDIIIPFIKRVMELLPDSKYEQAYFEGNNLGKHSLSPCKAPDGDTIELIMWNIGFRFGRSGRNIWEN
jgi:hypothetical protein